MRSRDEITRYRLIHVHVFIVVVAVVAGFVVVVVVDRIVFLTGEQAVVAAAAGDVVGDGRVRGVHQVPGEALETELEV